MKKKKSILRANLLLSIGFGMCMGVVFPLYSLVFVEFKSPLMGVFFTAGCIVAGFLVGIVAWLINTRTIVRMAKRLNAVMDGIPRGEAVNAGELRVDSDDVLGLLADNFRSGIEMFQKSVALLRGTARKAFLMSGEVESNVRTTRESTQILFKTIELIDGAAEELDRQNEVMEKGFDQLSKATLLNVANIIELYTSINEFGSTIYAQTESLNGLVETLRGIERSIGSDGDASSRDTLSALQANLGNRVQDTVDTAISIFASVKGRLAAIDGIAERTNVLSINAAIESARLGKEGSGFRIIAGNIKQLAGEVHTLTAHITAEMNAGESSIAQVTGSLSAAIADQSGIIAGIKDSIGALSERNDAVTAQMGSMEQHRAQIDTLLKDIKGNMQKLKDFVGETREALQLVVNTSMVIHAGVGTLSEKSVNIDENEKKVNTSLELFKKQVGEITLQVSEAQ